MPRRAFDITRRTLTHRTLTRRTLTLAVLAADIVAGCTTTGSHRAGPISPPSVARADSVGAEVVRGTLGARLDEYLTRASRFGFSGAVLVADSTGILLHKGYGLADRARGVPITTRTVFDMGSITKQFTAAAILTLEEEGRLSVRDSLGKYFPAVPRDKAGITLHHLLTHSSGISDPPIDDYDHVGRDSLVAATFAEPLGAPVGEKFIYSNAGFSLLAAVIERVRA